MEKLNITKGNWIISKSKSISFIKSVVSENDGSTICHIVDLDEFKENAKAISALPDILSEAYSVYLMLSAHPQHVIEQDQEFVDRVDGLHEALTKAGYEL